MSKRDLIIDELDDGAVILEGEEFDEGIIGVTIDGRVVYDYAGRWSRSRAARLTTWPIVSESPTVP